MANRRPTAPQQLEVRRFTPERAEWAIGLLERRIADVRALDPRTVGYNDETVRSLEQRIQGNVLEIFGENSREYRQQQYHQISGQGRRPIRVIGYMENPRVQEGELQRDFAQGIPRSVTAIQGLIETVRERTDSPRPTEPIAQETVASASTDEVFIVHGRADGPREAVARFVARLGLKPVILHEQASEGRTIIEKIERHSRVGYAVVLLTGDDRGGLAESDRATYQPRARQNVVLELGYFLGKLGRPQVCVLHEPGVEIPSDYDGVVYIPLDPGGAWQLRLAREMKAVAFHDIDLNRVM